MNKLKAEILFEKLAEIDDPRREHQKFHSLFDILVISICAVICGAEHWTEMEEFGVRLARMVCHIFRVGEWDSFSRHFSASVYLIG